MLKYSEKQREPRTLVIGIGNVFRCDDGVGLIVAQRVREKVSPAVKVLEASGEGAALMEAWKDTDSVILIDAVHSGAKPGTIHRLDAHTQPIPSKYFHYSTHAFSVAEAMELARALDQLPPRLVIYGIEGKTFEAGEKLSPEVGQAVDRVVKLILKELG